MTKLNLEPSAVRADVLPSLLAALPSLPGTVRYYDEFDEKVRSIENFDSRYIFSIYRAGRRETLDFFRLGLNYGCLAKHLFFHCITADLSISTVYLYIAALQHVEHDLLVDVLCASPMKIKEIWPLLFAKNLKKESFMALKWLLVMLSQRHLCGWEPAYLEFISSTLPLPANTKYSTVLTGDAFLSASEEAQIVHYLDGLVATSIRAPEQLTDATIRNGAMLMFSYLFGMRPYQIAKVAMRDVRIWDEQEGTHPSVHITFYMIKQRSDSAALPMVRRVKHAWAPLVLLLHERALKQNLRGSDRLFSVVSADDVGVAIKVLATEIAHRQIGANDFRHTAAQRLADSGASQEEVATFLGHTDITTCLVYFESSPNQADLINRALAISPTYQRVIKIAHDKFISAAELSELKEEEHIAGVPHGIPIAGIGGCGVGQPSCPYNPITSCYGCPNFKPVRDIELHRRVLGDLRGVVIFFADASREEKKSPAYQLRHTLLAVQEVIRELEDDTDA